MAEVTFKCGCGQTHSYTKDNGITVTAEKTAQESCLSAGKVVYTAAITFEGAEYTDDHEVVIPATGHQMTGTQSCTTASTCANCGYTVAALGHSWQADPENSVAATCKTNAVEAFKCAACGQTKTNTLEGLERHDFVYVEDVTVSGCVKAKLYRCSVCEEEETGDEYATHTYVASIQTEATCTQEGTKLYTCKGCGDSYTEAIPTNDSHAWDAGVTEGNITTYTCASCSTTKTAVVVTEGNTATVAKEALQNTEVQVNNAAIKLDEQTLEDLGEEVQIDVAVVDAADVNMDEELKAQIGENPVYDFSLSSDQNQVSQFAGFITISLPYELQEDDDVDCIDVWFIDDDGEVECVMGTYSGGQVAFTTDHFSYYTVTRLTPKQRCEQYGHLYNYSYKAPTCTANGYDVQNCKRCGHVEKDEVLPMVAHKFIETVQEATCTEDGYTSKKCPVCKLTISGVLPSLGHNWEKDESNSEDATCHAAGYETYVCDGCGGSYRNDLAQLEHKYETEEEVAPDCLNQGYKVECCALCLQTREMITAAPTGHDYAAENAVWEWAEDYTSATVTLICGNDESHTKTLTAVVGREMDDGSTCSSKITYKAVASFNKTEYTDTMVVDLGAVQHTPGTELLFDENTHYYQCQVCNGKVGAAEHTFGEGKILSESTCAENGKEEYQCTVCGAIHQYTILATGEHIYVDHVCSGCGLVENTCEHYHLDNIVAIDNEKWGICENTVIEFAACDCGEYTRFVRREGCEMPYLRTETVETNMGAFELNVTQCIYCGLICKTGSYAELDEENCITKWYDIYALYRGDQLIAIDYNLTSGNGMPEESWHLENEMRYVEVQAEGMCHNSVMETYCDCGEFTSYYPGESDCEWVMQPIVDEDVFVYICSVCGAKLTEEFNSVNEGCYWTNSRTYTYEMDGQQVSSFREEWGGQICELEIVDVTYIGGSCENGVIVHNECVNCGNTVTEYWTSSHPQIYEEYFYIEAEGYCWNWVRRSECPCGDDAYIDYSTSCSFELVEGDYDSEYQKFVCYDCGLTRTVTRTYGEKDENCNCYETVTYTYTDANGKELLKVDASTYGEFHDIQTTCELTEGAASCTDGVEATSACMDCGLVTNSETVYYHRLYTVDTYDCADYGMCGGEHALQVCACGAESELGYHKSRCNWEYQYTPETGMYYQCPTCNTIRTYDRYKVSEDGCAQVWNHDTVYIRDGEEVLRISAPYKEYQHRSYYTFELEGETCEDGYYVTGHCKDCNYESDWGYYSDDHDEWTVDREFVSQGKLCGDLEVLTYSCACGQRQEKQLGWWGDACSYEYSAYIPSLDAWRDKCTVCGVEQLHQTVETPGATDCETVQTDIYTYRKNGANLFNFQYRQTVQDHEYVHTFTLNGDICQDGYRVTGYCIDCGEARGDCGGEYTGGCATWRTERIVLEGSEALCSEAVINVYSCACGYNANVELEENDCDWNYLRWDSSTGTDVYHCSECGAYRYMKTTYASKQGTCEITKTVELRYEMDEKVIAQYAKTYTVREHVWIDTFTMNGETCQDGYSYEEACYFCGYSNGTWNSGGDHDTYPIEVVELSQYGMCGGYLIRYSCPCGVSGYWQSHNDACNWTWHGDVDPETGWDEDSCAVCKTVRRHGSNEIVDRENCSLVATGGYIFLRDGEVVYSVSAENRQAQHTEVYSYELFYPAEGCDGGYEVTVSCLYCDYGYNYSSSGCSVNVIKYFFADEVSDELCGGYAEQRSCACGKNQDVTYWDLDCPGWSGGTSSETDENGIEHCIEELSCGECGLTRITDSYIIVDEPNCSSTSYATVQIVYNDEVVFEGTECSVSEYHTFDDAQYSLLPGAETCDDGVVERANCKYCGEYIEEVYYYHVAVPAETVDLQQYGAVCDTQFVVKQCLCGYENYGELVGKEMCDMGEEEIEVWIEGAIVDTWQESSEGDRYFDSQAYILTCAVTDPQCMFKVRKANYWLAEENCTATRYETWQLGYNEQTGECAQEITFVLNEQRAYHNYVEEDASETAGDTSVSGYKLTCADCQSTYIYKTTYVDDVQTAWEEAATNLLDNGENKYCRTSYEYGLRYQDHSYVTMRKEEYTYASGTEYWVQYDYTYDFTDGCKLTRNTTDSNGTYYEPYNDDAHLESCTTETIKNCSCTQFGEYIDHWSCVVCGAATGEYTYISEPTAHVWTDEPNEQGIYECTICGLENVNGASGTIAMEDMTDSHGNGTDYVVGYWNQTDVSVHKYVSVVLKDAAEGEEDELILDGIVFTELNADTDGITAITFNQADVAAKAAAAMEAADYNGDYAIRFTFVPTDAGDTLDYAITFDTLSA